jgi:hypothetical protein
LRYYEDFSVNQKRMTQVKIALNLFTKQIEIGWNEETEKSLQQRKATIWKYTATFGDEPIDKQGSEIMPVGNSEMEYLDVLKAALAEGPLVESTRRIIERQRIKLGISPERAAELEQIISVVQLSDNEKEYLQDVEDCFADGVISDSERRILTRRREMLSISDDRAAELEQMTMTKKQGDIDK